MVRRIASLVVAGALTAGGAAFAGTKHSVDVKLDTPTVVNGQQLPAGDYQMSWTGDSSPVHVAFENGSKVVATVGARIEQRAQSENEELISRTTKDGKRALEEVRLAGKKTALVFPVS